MPASPCIDAGNNAAPYLPLQDKDGNARIIGSVVDMGAYEYSSTVLLLNDGRFSVTADWETPTGSTGQGTAVPLTTDSGYFWFFEGTNVELLAKIKDGRAVNGYYWFFCGAMTDVAYTITVTDNETGAVKTYVGVQHVQKSGNDIRAFEPELLTRPVWMTLRVGRSPRPQVSRSAAGAVCIQGVPEVCFC